MNYTGQRRASQTTLLFIPGSMPAVETITENAAASDPSEGQSSTTANSNSACNEASPQGWHIANRTLAVVSALLLILGVGGTLFRTITNYQVPGPFTPEAQGLCDFHNGIYYPTRALLAGESPYSEAYAAKYPVARQIPFFSPVILVLHAPLAVLPLRLAEILNTLVQIALLFAIAAIAAHAAGFRHRIDVALAIAAVMIFTRGGHITLFNGYFTYQLVIATFLAIAWAERRPLASGWMLMIVSAKPTYILPLGFLMLARGNFRALAIGAALSIGGALACLAWIAQHEGDGNLGTGVSRVLQQIIETQEVHRSMVDESPVQSWTRLDLFAVVAKWSGSDPGDVAHLAVMFGLLVVPMWVLWRRRNAGIDDGIAGLTGAILMLGVLVSLYHQSYDSLLMTAPLAGAIGMQLPVWKRMRTITRWGLIALMGFPAVNYLSTRTCLNRFELSEITVQIFTSLNGIGLTAALFLVCVMAWRTESKPA